MFRHSALRAIVFAAGLAAAPAFAQNAPAANPASATPPAANSSATSAPSGTATGTPPPVTGLPGGGTATAQGSATTPSVRNPLLADNGDARLSKVIGTSVYNDQNKKIGSVDDVLAGKDGALQAVLSVNGKLREVPFSKLQFGNAQENANNKIILPGQTQQALGSTPEFHYTNKNG